MRKRILLAAALALLCPAVGARAAAILVNEYNGVSAAQLPERGHRGRGRRRRAAADAYFGRVLGNGGDWLELVVIQDHLDLRGGLALDRRGHHAGRTTTVLTFTQDSLWSDLRSGTIITVAEDVPDDPSYDPLARRLVDQRAGQQHGVGSVHHRASNFSVSNDDTQITVLDALAAVSVRPRRRGHPPPTRRSAARGLEARGQPERRRSRRSRTTTTAARRRSARRTAGTAARTCRTSRRCARWCRSRDARRCSVSPCVASDQRLRPSSTRSLSRCR